MEQIYNSDKPIDDKNKDRFNRNKFSSRISQTIINRKSDWSSNWTAKLNPPRNMYEWKIKTKPRVKNIYKWYPSMALLILTLKGLIKNLNKKIILIKNKNAML